MSEPVSLTVEAREHDIGGFPVRRSLPTRHKRMVGPFIFLDHMGPTEIAAGKGMDVLPHPHIGLSTLTYLFSGSMVHRDSIRVEQEITPGAVNWMTAGRGVVQYLRSSPEARSRPELIHGLQIWIALPEECEDIDPTFFHYAASEIPEIGGSQAGLNKSKIKLVAGQHAGLQSPVHIYSDLLYVDASLAAGEIYAFESDESQELAVYLVDGNLQVYNRNGSQQIQPASLAILSPGEVSVQALTDSRFVIIGGKPFENPRYINWNFVSSSREKIDRAREMWQEQSFDKIPGETQWVPLPR